MPKTKPAGQQGFGLLDPKTGEVDLSTIAATTQESWNRATMPYTELSKDRIIRFWQREGWMYVPVTVVWHAHNEAKRKPSKP